MPAFPTFLFLPGHSSILAPSAQRSIKPHESVVRASLGLFRITRNVTRMSEIIHNLYPAAFLGRLVENLEIFHLSFRYEGKFSLLAGGGLK